MGFCASTVMLLTISEVEVNDKVKVRSNLAVLTNGVSEAPRSIVNGLRLSFVIKDLVRLIASSKSEGTEKPETVILSPSDNLNAVVPVIIFLGTGQSALIWVAKSRRRGRLRIVQ